MADTLLVYGSYTKGRSAFHLPSPLLMDWAACGIRLDGEELEDVFDFVEIEYDDLSAKVCPKCRWTLFTYGNICKLGPWPEERSGEHE